MGSKISAGSSFSLKGRRFHGLRGFEGKPFHPPLTDIPIGAYTIAPVLDLLAFVGRSGTWGRDLHTAASITLLAGAVVSVLTAITGLADWLTTTPGTHMRRMANAHALAMVTVTAIVITNLAVRALDDVVATTGPLLALSMATLALTVLGGMIGGSLVYDEGFNVRTPRGGDDERIRRAG